MKVSVIVPVYNHFRELRGLLFSLANQSYKNFECIIVNDGSEEKPDSELESLLKNANFSIKYFDREHKNASSARNFGAKYSNGEFLLFCDADIQLKEGALERFVNALQNANESVTFVYSEFYFGHKKMRGIEFDFEKLKEINYIHTTSLIRKKYFPCFDENLNRFQDWDLWLSISKNGSKGMLIPEVLFNIKTRKNGISQWFPSFFLKKPLIYFTQYFQPVEKYILARKTLEVKHDLKKIL